MTPKQYAVLFWSTTALFITGISLMVIWLVWGLYDIMPSALNSNDNLVLFFIFVSITIYIVYALVNIMVSAIALYLKHLKEMKQNG
ncbi:MAG: hypothetical protein PHN69_06050 [Candidatus Pacebacteria bacterium]|nr:hypothetical protein [Candidatus Paceibacterota bacterium]